MTIVGERVDLLVLGGGMAGLTAAAKAASEGASVVLAEKGPGVGGSAAYAGYIDRVVTGYDEAMEWVRSLGVHVADPVAVLGYGRGSQTDVASYLQACERLVRDRGELLVRYTAVRLLLEGGVVVGAELRARSGERREVRALDIRRQ